MKNKQKILDNYLKNSKGFIELHLKNVWSLHKAAFIIFFILLTNFTYGQGVDIGQFAIWKAKDGQLRSFEEGYKQHLNWHKDNGDKWGWYGWFIISGPRYGQFVDATFGHAWADFDNAVKPLDDMADNKLHVFPFADVQIIFKVVGIPEASSVNTLGMKTKFIKLVTLTVDDMEQSLKMSEKLKDYYSSKQIKFYKTYKVVDGGNINQMILMLGFDNWEDYAKSEDLNKKIAEFEQILKIDTIRSIVSETMIYRPDLSFFPN